MNKQEALTVLRFNEDVEEVLNDLLPIDQIKLENERIDYYHFSLDSFTFFERDNYISVDWKAFDPTPDPNMDYYGNVRIDLEEFLEKFEGGYDKDKRIKELEQRLIEETRRRRELERSKP